jgi:hypothetical protein
MMQAICAAGGIKDGISGRFQFAQGRMLPKLVFAMQMHPVQGGRREMTCLIFVRGAMGHNFRALELKIV